MWDKTVDINKLRILKKADFPEKCRKIPSTTYCVLERTVLRYIWKTGGNRGYPTGFRRPCARPSARAGWIPAESRGTMQGGRIMKKRLLALLLCLVMVIGLVPTVLAGEDETAKDSTTFHFCYLNGSGKDYIVKVEKGQNKTVSQPTDPPAKANFLWDGKWYYTFSQITDGSTPTAVGEWIFSWPVDGKAHDDVYLFPGYTANNVTEEAKYTVTFRNVEGAGSTEYTVDSDATLEIPSFEKIKTDKNQDWAVPNGKELAGWRLVGDAQDIYIRKVIASRISAQTLSSRQSGVAKLQSARLHTSTPVR